MVARHRYEIASAFVIAALFSSVNSAQAQTAEDASAACLEAARLIEENDFANALDEAKWCVESLEQLKRERTFTVFPDEIDGFVGGELQNESALGMSMIEREYSRDGDIISVSLISGGVGGGFGAGGLAALAQLGLGAGGAGKKIRVQKRTVIDMSESSGNAQFLVQLKSSQGMLTISSDNLSSDEVLTFVRAFPIKDLDEALEP